MAQLEQLFELKQGSSGRNHHEGRRLPHIGPCNGQREEPITWPTNVDAFIAPVLALRYDLKLASTQGMKGMGNTLADSALGGASSCVSERVDCALQLRTLSQRAWAIGIGSAAKSGSISAVWLPTPIGGRCTRSCELGAGRRASPIFACSGVGGFVVVVAETAE